MPETLTDVCRLCLSKEGLMLPIFRNEDPSQGTAFRYKIMSCASISIFADDGLPTKVCHNCFHQVEKSFQFRKMCENSDAILRSQSEQTKVENAEDIIAPEVLKLDCIEKKEGWSGQTQNLSGDKWESLSHNCNMNENCFQDRSLQLEGPICSFCSLVFSSYDHLINHFEDIHANVESYFCKVCNLSIPNLNEFKVHVNLKHSLACGLCDQVFKHQSSLEMHKKTHTEEQYICRFCKQVFDKITLMRKHELHHLEKVCQFCNKELLTKEHFDVHVKECMSVYHCQFCEQTFELKRELIEHVNHCHDESSLEKCNTCQKTFHKTDVQQHVCENQIENNLQCKTCEVDFNELSLLDSHMAMDHSEEILNCRFCTKAFSLKSSLRRHEKSHSGLKPYQCKFCPRKFKDNSTCIVHMRTHTGEHPFRCQECHKDFKQLANLKMHTYRHHKKIKLNERDVDLELTEPNQTYHQLYSTQITEKFSVESTRVYQHLEMSQPLSFEHSVNMT